MLAEAAVAVAPPAATQPMISATERCLVIVGTAFRLEEWRKMRRFEAVCERVGRAVGRALRSRWRFEWSEKVGDAPRLNALDCESALLTSRAVGSLRIEARLRYAKYVGKNTFLQSSTNAREMAFVHQSGAATPRRLQRSSRLSRDRVSEIQRSRMLAAALATVEEVGYGGMTVAQVIGRAKVSRKTFYDMFADREDCFLAALEQSVAQAGRRVQAAYESESVWRERVRAGLGELLAFFDDEPALARLVLVEALGAGPRVLEWRAGILDRLAQIVDEGRSATGAGREPPAVVAEGVVGAVFAVLHTRALGEDGDERFGCLLGSLMNIVVLPYLGARVGAGN